MGIVKRNRQRKPEDRYAMLLDDRVGIDYLDPKKYENKIKKHKRERKKLEEERDDIRRQISMTKSSVLPKDQVNAEVKNLKKAKKKLEKAIKKKKSKIKKHKQNIHKFDERYDLSYEVEQIVNSDGLFRTPDTRYIDNGLFDISIHAVGQMLNHARPNYHKIASMVESIIGNLSLCMCDCQSIDNRLIHILNSNILRQKKILDVIDPISVVVYNKFLMLSRLENAAIIYECDRISKTNKFSTSYRRFCEGKYAFDQFVDFSKFQRRFMTQEQQILFSQYQRVIRVLEDMGYVDCKSGKLKQRFRNGVRDLGIKRNQIGQLVQYTYDKSLDAARQYYAEKDKNLSPVFDYLHTISRFTPDYAGEMYAMDKF